MAQNTALQTLINWINSDYRTQIEVEIQAKELLESERDQIEKAYNQGDSDRDNQQDGNGRTCKNCMDYYNQTFTQNK